MSEKMSDLRLVFVGGSHADRMAAVADRRGIEHVNLVMPGKVANLGDFSPKNANLEIFWPLGN
jgi:hypothetical protein